MTPWQAYDIVLDHVVMAADSLESGEQWLASRLGVTLHKLGASWDQLSIAKHCRAGSATDSFSRHYPRSASGVTAGHADCIRHGITNTARLGVAGLGPVNTTNAAACSCRFAHRTNRDSRSPPIGLIRPQGVVV